MERAGSDRCYRAGAGEKPADDDALAAVTLEDAGHAFPQCRSGREWPYLA